MRAMALFSPSNGPRTPSLLRLLNRSLALAAALLLAAWALHGQFSHASFAALAAGLLGQPAGHIAAAMALTCMSFACLGLYDLAGARDVAPQVRGSWAWMTGMLSNAVSNTLGFHAVTGSLIRARLYSRCGLGAGDIARIVSLSWLALGLGFVTMLALSELLDGVLAPRGGTSLAVGLALALLLTCLVAWLARAPRAVSLWSFRQPLPSARAALLQMALGAVESASAIGALYVLLPADLSPPFSVFAVGCIAAVALGVASHMPGGVGVFEASVTAVVGGAGRADLLAALILYRAIYNLLPFAVACAVLAALRPPKPAQFDGG